MVPYHILIVIISSVIPENLVLLTKSEQSGPKSAHIRPTKNLLPNMKLLISEIVARNLNSDVNDAVQKAFTVLMQGNILRKTEYSINPHMTSNDQD